MDIIYEKKIKQLKRELKVYETKVTKEVDTKEATNKNIELLTRQAAEL